MYLTIIKINVLREKKHKHNMTGPAGLNVTIENSLAAWGDIRNNGILKYPLSNNFFSFWIYEELFPFIRGHKEAAKSSVTHLKCLRLCKWMNLADGGVGSDGLWVWIGWQCLSGSLTSQWKIQNHMYTRGPGKWELGLRLVLEKYSEKNILKKFYFSI